MRNGFVFEPSSDVSIHAPARGATRSRSRHTRCRPVSIHAPARGATTCIFFRPTLGLWFQSTPLHEGRPGTAAHSPHLARFNPRPCTRGDQFRRSGGAGSMRFNPRPCTRGDWIFPSSPAPYGVSIHAPARGATLVLTALGGSDLVSIHAPARGATGCNLRPRIVLLFQSTPLHEGRPRWAWSRSSCLRSFNPRPCTRGDAPLPAAPLPLDCFNPRPCTRGDTARRAELNGTCPVSIHAPARGATH